MTRDVKQLKTLLATTAVSQSLPVDVVASGGTALAPVDLGTKTDFKEMKGLFAKMTVLPGLVTVLHVTKKVDQKQTTVEMIDLCVKNVVNVDLKSLGQFVKVIMTKEESEEGTTEQKGENNREGKGKKAEYPMEFMEEMTDAIIEMKDWSTEEEATEGIIAMKEETLYLNVDL